MRDGYDHTRSEQTVPAMNPPAMVKQQSFYRLIVLNGPMEDRFDDLDTRGRSAKHQSSFVTNRHNSPPPVAVGLDRDGAGIIRDKARASLMNTESLGAEIHRKILREEAEDSAEHLEAGEQRGKSRRGRREGKYPVLSCYTGSQV